MTNEEIREELIASVNAYKNGARDKDYVVNQIEYYREKYDFSDYLDIMNMLSSIKTNDNINNKKKEEKNEEEKLEKIRKIIGIIALILIIGIIAFYLWACVDLIHSSLKDDNGDYTTYYNDENGNGKLDRGEGNYTEDENGNVVDWDEDNNNFE